MEQSNNARPLLGECCYPRAGGNFLERVCTARKRKRASLALAWVLASAAAHGQEDLNELVVRSWDAYTPQARAEFLAGGLTRADAESKGLALAGVARLAGETPDVARSKFDPETIRVHFSDPDPDVVKQALLAYRLLVPDDAQAEAAIVQRAQQDGEPLKDWEYIRYLRPNGISSKVAQAWLLTLADGAISESKFSAAEALVMGIEVPPPSLLSDVLELIQSPEYFCRFNLVQFLPKFGPAAATHLVDLMQLRQELVEEMALPADKRSVTLVEAPDEVLRMLDQTISKLQ